MEDLIKGKLQNCQRMSSIITDALISLLYSIYFIDCWIIIIPSVSIYTDMLHWRSHLTIVYPISVFGFIELFEV